MADEATAVDLMMDDIEAQVEKRLRGGGGGDSSKSAPVSKKARRTLKDVLGDGQSENLPKQASGAQIFGLVLDIFKTPKSTKWLKVRVLVLEEHSTTGEHNTTTTEKRNYIDIPHGLKATGLEMILAKLTKRTAETRSSWRVPLLQAIDMTSFNDKGIKIGELVWCSGVRYEVSAFVPRTDDKAPKNETATEGDAIPDITCEYLNPIKDDSKLALLGKLLANVKIGPVSELAYGAEPIQYTNDTPRWNDLIDFRGRILRGAMIPFDITNEVLFSHSCISPSTVIHICNKLYRTLHESLPGIKGEETLPIGPTPCVSKIPDRDCLVREVKDDTRKRPVLASAKGSDQNGKYSITVADLGKDVEGSVLGIFWESEIKKLGVQGLPAWEEYGNQIVRGLDAIVAVKIDKADCFVDDNYMEEENRRKYYLGAERLTFVQIDFKETFRWIGVRVGLEIAEQICLRGLYGKQWQLKPKRLAPRWKEVATTPTEVTPSSKLTANPGDQSVKVVCLAEATGEIAALTPPENWFYYMIPPGFSLNEPDPGQYLEELGYYKINDMTTESEREAEIDKIIQGPNIDKWTVFAIRR